MYSLGMGYCDISSHIEEIYQISILGVGMDGRKEILGLYFSESEGANFWLSVLTDLNNRGLKDILIVSVDGLKGFPEAIKTIFPKTEVQLCIIHQIRNCFW